LPPLAHRPGPQLAWTMICLLFAGVDLPRGGNPASSPFAL
jgi:hypothetical protein